MSRVVRFCGETLLAVAVAAAASVGLQMLLDPINVPDPSFAPVAVLATGGALLLAWLVGLAAWRRWRWWGVPLAWLGLSALGTLAVAMLVPGTRFYLNGISADQHFRTQYLTRLTSSPVLADLNYADLPPYYPAGWFWLGGRFARLMDLDGWEAYRPFAILTMAVGGVLAFTLWSVVVGRRAAVLLAVVTVVAGLRTAAYEPYSWALAACLPPVAAVAWRHLRAAAAGERPGVWPAVGVGCFLGACGAVYTLLLGFTGVLLAAMGVGALLVERRLAGLWALVVRFAVIGAVAAPITLLVWTPYLRAVLVDGTAGRAAAARFLPEIGALWPVPMLQPSVGGALTLAGTAWIVLRWRGNPVAQALGMVAGGVYVWFGLSTAALALGSTLLAFRFEPLLHAALGCAGALGMIDVLRWVLRSLARREADATATTTTEPTEPPAAVQPPRGSVVALAAVLAAGAMLSLVQTAPAEYEWARDASLDDYYPTGTTPRGDFDRRVGGAWNDDLLEAVDELTAGTPPDRLVILTAHTELLAYRAYFGFQSTLEQYANPLADYPGRRATIESWATSRSPAELAGKLDTCRYRAPTVFVLFRTTRGMQATVTEDTFPAQPNYQARDVMFDEDLFAEPYFRRRDVGMFAVIVRAG